MIGIRKFIKFTFYYHISLQKYVISKYYIHFSRFLGIKYQNSDIEFKYDNTMRSRICKPKTFMSFHLQNSIYIFPKADIWCYHYVSMLCYLHLEWKIYICFIIFRSRFWILTGLIKSNIDPLCFCIQLHIT